MNYSYEDITKALKEVGIKKGDAVYVSSNLGVIGLPPPKVKNVDDLCKLFYDALLEVLGDEGKLYVPTFSYTFGKSTASEPAVFDIKNTPAEIGAFPNFVLKQRGVKRSIDPMLSVSCIGKNCEEIFVYKTPSTYAEGSFLSKLAKSNIKLLNIGISYKWMPFIHYIDWLLKTPYRYDKIFNGILKKDESFNIPWIYSVRILSDVSYPYADRVAKKAYEAGIWKSSPLGRIKIYSCVSKEYFEFALKEAKKDKWILAKGPKTDVIKVEKERVSEDLSKIKSVKSLSDIPKLALDTRRDIVSDSSEIFLKNLKKFIPFQIKKIKSGTQVGSYIVPEKWRLREFFLKNPRGEIILSENDSFNIVASYSLPIKNTISKDKLLKHSKVNFYGRENIKLFNNRDWILSLNIRDYEKIDKEEKFEIVIDTDFAMGEMLIGEKSLQGKSNKYIVFASYYDGPYKIDENISGVVFNIFLYEELARIKDLKNSYTFLFLPSKVGLSGWIHTTNVNIEKIFHFKHLGNKNPFTIIANRKLDIDIPAYIFPEEFFYGYGNNPSIDKIDYSNIPNIFFGRTKQPFSVKFPQEYTNLDTDQSFNIDSIKESIKVFIKKFLSENV